jgi:hypothetical protein
MWKAKTSIQAQLTKVPFTTWPRWGGLLKRKKNDVPSLNSSEVSATPEDQWQHYVAEKSSQRLES